MNVITYTFAQTQNISNAPQGVEKVHYEGRIDIDSSDRGIWYTVKLFEWYLILE